MSANINLNLQSSDNYYIILRADKLLKSKDVTFQIKNFEIPSMEIQSADVKVLQNVIKFPSQGIMSYAPLELEVLLDDNLNSYLELAKWINRLKDPEKLLQAHIGSFEPNNMRRDDHPLVQIINSSNQHLIEYRDLDVYTTDRQHIGNFRFNFVDSWISKISGLKLDAQEAKYITFNVTFYYLYMRVFDSNNNQIIPQLDTVQKEAF